MRLFMVVLLAVWLAGALLAADPSDDQIYDKVRITLANDKVIKGGAIDVKVNHGVVELSGTVKQEKQRSKAEKAAKKVKGVHKVVNNLKIAPV